MRLARPAALAAIAVLGTAACLPSRSTEPASDAAPVTPAASKPANEEERQREIEKRSELRSERPAAAKVDAPAEAKDAPVTGEVPEAILDQMRADLATRAGRSADHARVVRAEQVVWPDGSVGCGKPGVLYTQQTVSGYLVEFEFENKRYRYHAPLAGGAIYCERPGPFLERLGPAQ